MDKEKKHDKSKGKEKSKHTKSKIKLYNNILY